mmetsp:Transcript_36327/g.79242  ORF Transcript_36327/g.79242 Transcript_36327/m.79242 type:complete len:306 (+) Transcript_36327:64-981(+)
MAWDTFRTTFHFSTYKKVLIRDWRLGLALRTLQCCVIVYALLRLFWRLEYLAPEVPSNFMIIESTTNASFVEIQEAMWAAQATDWDNSRCGPAGLRRYDFNHSHVLGNFSVSACEALPSHAVGKVGNEKNSFTLMTARQKISEARLPAPRRNMDPASCEAHFLETTDVCRPQLGQTATYAYSPIPVDFTMRKLDDFGSCVCQVGAVLLETGVEVQRVVITHEVRSKSIKKDDRSHVICTAKNFHPHRRYDRRHSKGHSARRTDYVYGVRASRLARNRLGCAHGSRSPGKVAAGGGAVEGTSERRL